MLVLSPFLCSALVFALNLFKNYEPSPPTSFVKIIVHGFDSFAYVGRKNKTPGGLEAVDLRYVEQRAKKRMSEAGFSGSAAPLPSF